MTKGKAKQKLRRVDAIWLIARTAYPEEAHSQNSHARRQAYDRVRDRVRRAVANGDLEEERGGKFDQEKLGTWVNSRWPGLAALADLPFGTQVALPSVEARLIGHYPTVYETPADPSELKRAYTKAVTELAEQKRLVVLLKSENARLKRERDQCLADVARQREKRTAAGRKGGLGKAKSREWRDWD